MKNNILGWLSKKQEVLILTSMALTVFAFYAAIVLPLNIHGDAKFHTLYAKESVQSGYLAAYQPHALYTINGSNRTYAPVAYPLTSESLFSILYILGGECALKLYAPIFATLIFLLAYLCLREIGKLASASVSLIAVLVIGERLVMTPLIEPFMTVLLLAGIVSFKKYFQEKKAVWLLLGAFFFGAGASVKQQGLTAMIFTSLFLFGYFLWRITREPDKKQLIKLCAAALALMIIVPLPAFIDQSNRNGTITVAPGKMNLPKMTPFKKQIQPLVTSKFATRQGALEALDKRIGYNKTKLSIIDKAEGFLLAPFLYYRTDDPSWRAGGAYTGFCLILLTIIGLAFARRDTLLRRTPPLWALLAVLIIGDILVSYVMQTPVHQYHTFGIILTTMILAVSVVRLAKGYKVYGAALVAALFLLGLRGYLPLATPLWSDAGREDDQYIDTYQKVGQFVQENTDSRAVFLAAETTFRYYGQRDAVWANDANADSVAQALNSSDTRTILQQLKSLKVDYVVIDKGQLDRHGLYDYLPPDGLALVIQHSPNFRKLYKADGEREVIVYKVVYGGIM